MFRLIEGLNERQIEDLVRLYQGEWWTRERKIQDVRRMLSHSDLIFPFVESETGRLVAFARVLTDYVYKALIFDVIVDRRFRDQGLGRSVVDRILDHPAIRAVEHIELYCLPELVPFYERWRFIAGPGGLLLLRLRR